MIRAVLVDDEPLAIQELEYILSKVSFVEIVCTFTDALEALAFIQMEEPDVVFMDIDMPQMSGIQLTEKLRTSGIKTKVIYATAYDAFAIKAFDQSAIDYLLKPYDAERIYAAVLKIKQHIKHSSTADSQKNTAKPIERLSVWIGEKMILIHIDEIVFCAIENNRTTIRTDKATYEINDSLANLESKLPQEKFIRTHRAYIVNLTKIREISPYFNNTLVLKLEGCKDEIPVSRSYIKTFKGAMHIN